MERHVPLEGAQNFRDLGGYETASGAALRWGVLFRTATLSDVTPGDIATLRKLGLEIVFDLRTQTERDDLGVAPLEQHGVSVRHTPVVEQIRPELSPVKESIWDWTPRHYARQYVWLLEQGREAFGAVLRALADERPAATAYHCTGGRDRAGLLTAVILRALGVTDEVISADYALTERYLRYDGTQSERHAKTFKIEPRKAGRLSTPAANMDAALRAMDERWSSIGAYLEECEVSEAALNGLQEHLLQPDR